MFQAPLPARDTRPDRVSRRLSKRVAAVRCQVCGHALAPLTLAARRPTRSRIEGELDHGHLACRVHARCSSRGHSPGMFGRLFRARACPTLERELLTRVSQRAPQRRDLCFEIGAALRSRCRQIIIICGIETLPYMQGASSIKKSRQCGAQGEMGGEKLPQFRHESR
jgi:hypothetical protein